MVLRFLCVVGIALLAGCGGRSGPATVNASGVVTLDGVGVAKAQVVFLDDAAQYPASATTDEQGNFSLKTNGEFDGAVPGNYKVQVSKTLLSGNEDGGAEVTISHGLPKKYASVVTSGMTFTVPESGTSDIKLELSSN